MDNELDLNISDKPRSADSASVVVDDDKNKPDDKALTGEENKDKEGEAGKEKIATKPEEKSPPRNRVQERINDITKARRTAEADATRTREILKAVVGEEPPKPSDFKTPAEYTAAFMEYATKVEIPKARLQEAEARMGEADSDYVQTLVESWDERIEAEKAADPDWEKDVKTLKVKTTPKLNLAIMESDYGPKILKFLAKNPDEAYNLVTLSPSAQLRRIGYLELKVQDAAPSKVAPKAKENERPNDPPDNSVKGGKNSGGTKDPVKMSMAEYRKFRGLD